MRKNFQSNLVLVVVFVLTSFGQNVVVSETRYQRLEIILFCDRERAQLPSIKMTVLTFLMKKVQKVEFDRPGERSPE